MAISTHTPSRRIGGGPTSIFFRVFFNMHAQTFKSVAGWRRVNSFRTGMMSST